MTEKAKDTPPPLKSDRDATGRPGTPSKDEPVIISRRQFNDFAMI